SRRRHTRCYRDWSSDVCSSDLPSSVDSFWSVGRPNRSWSIVGGVLSARIARSCSPTDRSPPMTKPISPLRQRMIDDMTMRNLSPSTQETYIRAVAQFSTFHWRSPDKLGVEHLREYHLHLVSRGLSANSICVKMSALRFFYRTTLRRPAIAGQIPMPRRLDHLPTVLAREEVEHLLKAVA